MSGSVRRSALGCCARILRPTAPHQVDNGDDFCGGGNGDHVVVTMLILMVFLKVILMVFLIVILVVVTMVMVMVFEAVTTLGPWQRFQEAPHTFTTF